jgi:hypothetical protein
MLKQSKINLPQLLTFLTLLFSVVSIVMLHKIDVSYFKGVQSLISFKNPETNNPIAVDLLSGIIVILVFSILWIIVDLLSIKFKNDIILVVLSILFSLAVIAGSILTIYRMRTINKTYKNSHNKSQVDAMMAIIYTCGGLGICTSLLSIYKNIVIISKN